ncbi:hypothetical protein Tco_0802460 [Tanacetum coccineum]|uniref:Uncharacterized protein n=1 Tax=Tanacetum coccineum TaxID=301880 RepID=A0ABQ4ZZS1_9ASTR
MSMSVQKSQVHKMAKSQDGKELSCDDPQNAQEHNDKYKFKEQAHSRNQRHYNIFTRESKEYELKTKHEAYILQLAIDGVGFDWSFRQRWQIPTTFLLCISQIQSLDKLIGCQISDNNRKGVGYNAVAPPPTGLFAPPTIDLLNSGLEEFKQPKFGGYGVKVNKSVSENSSKEIKKPRERSWISVYSKSLFCMRFNHLIKDCDFHDKKMVQKPVLNNVKKGTGQREVRPVWNNAMRTNHQNFSNSRSNFAPTAVLTKSGLVPISTARQSSSRAAAPVSTARPIKTAAPKPFVNVVKSRPNAFQKSHSPSRRSFYQHTALKNRNLNNRVNTVKVNSVNTAKGKRVISAVGKQGNIMH